MLTLTFQFGDEFRGIPYSEIEEVVALVDLTAVGAAPPAVVGAFNYHGIWVPVVDLSELAVRRPAARRWSTRILILRPDFTGRFLGLIAESATEMITRADDSAKGDSPKALQIADLLDAEQKDWLRSFEAPSPTDAQPARNRRRPRHYSQLSHSAASPRSNQA
ncbi:MAG: chemotaxis protein CheW [Verrucomicrobiae bacterium]|jgi:chemotaxis-related protein WspB|nr:chemotaxis protein CheW [Verrucomicrobiae bacterium]